jgi:hypothetical protein
MSLLKKCLLSLILFLFISVGSFAQSGWISGNYYAYQGKTWTDYTYVTVGYDYYGNPINQKRCRQTTWYQEYREGYVSVWGPNGWYSEWKSGYYWYYKWSAWYNCY